MVSQTSFTDFCSLVSDDHLTAVAPASTSSIVFSLLSSPLLCTSLAWELRGVVNDQKLSPSGLGEEEKAIHKASLHKLIYIHPF